MSVDQKQNVILKEVGQERSTLEANLSGIKSSSSSSGEGESSESDTGKCDQEKTGEYFILWFRQSQHTSLQKMFSSIVYKKNVYLKKR